MINSYILLLASPLVAADWVQIPTLPKVESERKGEDGDGWGCEPNIHSWTAATWNTTSRETEPLPGSPRSIDGKLLVLRALHQDLMETLGNRVDDLEGREARTLPKGMGTKESALITISLLTFAVYLIKLVTMLINVIQEKKGADINSELFGSTVQPSSQTFIVSHGRRKRRGLDEDSVHILKKLQQFN